MAISPARILNLIIIVVVIWSGCSVGIYLSRPNWSERGQFGDMFGAVNALFSALAFAILIVTMWMQREELELQRAEVRQTNLELKRTADAQEMTRRAMEKQIELLTVSTRMSAWLKAQDIWTDGEFTRMRGGVFSRKDNEVHTWSEAELMEGRNVCRRIDEFSHLAQFLGEEAILEHWANPIAKSWLILKPIVLEERLHSQWALKWHAFESMGTAAALYVNERGRP